MSICLEIFKTPDKSERRFAVLNLFSAFRPPSHQPWAGSLVQPRNSVAPADVDRDDFESFPFEIIHKPRLVIHLLHQAVTARLPVMLSSPHLGSGMPTRLLEVAPDSGELFIRCLSDEGAHAAVLSDGHFNLLIRQSESPLLMSMPLSRIDNFNRQACYVTPLPAWAVSSQMRSWRRVRLPAGSVLTLHHTFADQDSIEAPVTDLSEGGLCLASPHHPLRGIRPYERWPDARLAFKNTEIGPLALKVVHIRHEVSGQRIGLAIEEVSAGQSQALRRLLLRLQSGGR
jgi:c-di-GMP-binding flagellar brake protein YcgR